MLSSLSSIVRTLRYIKSPCIFLFPGGGFQLLMVRTRRHCKGCGHIFLLQYITGHLLKPSQLNSFSVTLRSSLTGCRGISGRSLHPGRMYSGGRKSPGSFMAARLFPTLSTSVVGENRGEEVGDAQGGGGVKGEQLYPCLLGCKRRDRIASCS